MMIASIARLSPRFNMQRAVIEYVEQYDVPAARLHPSSFSIVTSVPIGV